MKNIKFSNRSYQITDRSKFQVRIRMLLNGKTYRYLFLTHFYKMHDPEAEFRYYKASCNYIQC